MDESPLGVPDDLLDADAYVQPSDQELIVLRQRAALPDVAGVSYRCPPSFEDGALA